MDNPLQPQFIIRIYDKKIPNGTRIGGSSSQGATVVKTNDGYIDIQACVGYPVEYEETMDLLTHLRFTVNKNAETLIYYFFVGQTIQLFGGFYTEDNSGMREIFAGSVTRVRTHFDEAGRVSFAVECMSYGYTKLGKNKKCRVYPDPNSDVNFAKKDKLSVKDIVEGIAKENGFEMGEFDLSTEGKKVNYDKIEVRYQKNETDWKFLVKLAQDLGCSVWVSHEDGKDKLNFMSHQKAFNKQGDISFFYPLFGEVTDIKDSEMQRARNSEYDRPRILREVSVDEDISQADAVTRSATYYDRNTGEYKEAISRIETDKDGNATGMVFYELDEQRVEQVHRENPELADEIRNNGPSSMEWGTPDNPRCAAYYYKEIRRYDESGKTAVFDKAFYGITVSGKVNMDLDIHSHRTYKIRGVLSYHSKDKETSFFLRGLKHIWDADGCWTELDFIR